MVTWHDQFVTINLTLKRNMCTLFLPAVILYVIHIVYIHTSTLPKITHPVCRGDESRQKQPSITRKHKGHKGRKIKRCQPKWECHESASEYLGCKRYFQNCWFWSQAGAAPLFLCPRNEKEVPRRHIAGLKVASSLPVTLWLPSRRCQHKTALHSTLNKVYSTHTQAIYSCPHQLQRLQLEKQRRCWYFTDLSSAHVVCRSTMLAYNTKVYQGYKNTQSPFFLKTNYGRIMLSPWLIIFASIKTRKSSNWCFPSGLNNFHWQLR